MSTARARELRKKLSPPEAKMWNVLRREPFVRHHFRRQVPLGPFYADFASHEAKLVIEIDGAQHFEEAAQRYDASRDAFIAAQGYRVVRFTTPEILGHIDSVAATLLDRLPRKNT
jgi:very-short-patch-repair endonuclease